MDKGKTKKSFKMDAKKTPKAPNLKELVKSWKTLFSPAIKHCSRLRHTKDGKNTFAITFAIRFAFFSEIKFQIFMLQFTSFY